MVNESSSEERIVKDKVLDMELGIHERFINGVFADLAVVHSNPDNVSLTFIQKIPFNLEKEKTEEKENAGNIVGRINLSWPHFYRLVKVLNNVAKREKERVVKHLDESISSFDGLENEGLS